MSRPLRIVHLTPGLPVPAPVHAGGMLQRDVTRSIQQQDAELRVLVPDLDRHREQLADTVAQQLELPERGPARGGPRGLAIRAAHRLNGRAYRAAVQRAHPPYVLSLLLQPRLWRLLRGADVIDLQWFAQIRLVPLIRLLAGPRPVLVGTFHDVVSQRQQRAALAPTAPGGHEAPARGARLARRLERRLLPLPGRRSRSRLDRAVVLSEKDRRLLLDLGADPRRVLVLPPRFEAPAGLLGPDHDPDPDRETVVPVVLFVGYLFRHENQDAARWLMQEIWPRVRAAVPGARLRIVGGGAPADLLADAAAEPGVEAAGFVDDLWAEYRAARCSVIPLRDGAGVKFKTIESLIAGLPTVVTPIGAEGAGDAEDFVVVSARPEELATGIVAALTDPALRRRAVERAPVIARRHGPEAFDAAVAAAYLTPRS